MTQGEMDEASEAWEWIPSDTIWLEKNVSSDFYIPPQPFPVPRISRWFDSSASMVFLPNFPFLDADVEVMNLEKILKDKDCHSWDGTPGERQTNRAPMVNGQLFAGLGHFGHDSTARRYELDLHARDVVNNTQIVQHLNQGSVIQDKAICYVNAVRAMKCTGKDSAGGACGGYQVLKQAVKAIFPHLKGCKIYTAAMVKRKCEAATAILVPLDEETVPIAIVIPKHLCPHTHPPPPATRVPTDVRLLYERAVRAYGISVATVNKVEQVSSTIEIMGAAPGLVHPSTKQTIIAALKRHEPGGDKSGWEGDTHCIQAIPRRSLPSCTAMMRAEPRCRDRVCRDDGGRPTTRYTAMRRDEVGRLRRALCPTSDQSRHTCLPSLDLSCPA
ncbi:hypothetical protein B0H14DRAFT_3490182 [Mycena olivaceomarginata]|nr:hypothetical protein B0H14DRAFT_3490182 [Mycena olivaceomarginata]